MYLNYYRLNSKPFSISPDPKFLWLGEKHAEALASLKYGILEDKGILLLTGEIGTGKTLLINCLLKSIIEDVVVATIPDPSLKLIDFYNILSNKFEMNKKFESKVDFLINFEKFLVATHRERKKVLLIIDEAQRLKSKLLDEIRVLSNIEFENKKLINIFFVGQRELKEMLLEERNRPLKQRITNNYHLMPLTEKETSDFILHRLKIAGATREIFTQRAIREIHNFSQGVPRLINIICDHSLLTGYSQSLTMIDIDVIKECAEELQISADKSFTPLKRPNYTEADIFSNESEIIEYLKRPKTYETTLNRPKDNKYLSWFKPSEKLSNIKIASIVATIFLFGIAVIFINSRFAESGNRIKQENELSNLEDAETNLKPAFMKAKANDGSQDTLLENSLSNAIHEKKINEEKIISYVAKIKKVKKIKKDPASKNILQSPNEENLKSKPLESDKIEENRKELLTNFHKVQIESNDEGFNISKNLTIKKTEKLKENTLSTNEIPEYSTHTDKSSEVQKSNNIKLLQKPEKKTIDKIFNPIDSGKFLSFKDQKFFIHFEANSVNLDRSSYAMLNKVAETVYKNPNLEIIIEGHADSYGGDVFNKRLSKFRANMIKSYLIGKGVDYSRISAIGFGSDRPIADNLTSEGREKNRRVEIQIKTKS
jgi:type II secretory pathway predicted ATPase ExeA/outer membrane protein OmpA-like peptidoglycan-associated protein